MDEAPGFKILPASNSSANSFGADEMQLQRDKGLQAHPMNDAGKPVWPLWPGYGQYRQEWTREIIQNDIK